MGKLRGYGGKPQECIRKLQECLRRSGKSGKGNNGKSSGICHRQKRGLFSVEKGKGAVGMERNYMRTDSLVELDFITERHIAFHSHENFEFLFVISGKMVITVGEDAYQFSPGICLW